MAATTLILALTGGLFLSPAAAIVREAPAEEHVIVKLKPAEAPQGESRIYGTRRPKAAQNGEFEPLRDIQPGGAWIGVQFGPVPKPLAAHLKLDESAGQMVLNVAEGSPADAAGIQQYDVITDVDGNRVSSKLGEFLDMVQGFTPNETHQFGLIRGAAPMNVRVIVGSRPADWHQLKYKYEFEEEPLSGTQLFQRGGMLQRDPQGRWQFQDLGQLKDLEEIWKNLPQFDPKDMQFAWQGRPDSERRVQIFVENGRETRIERDEDGKITVTKTDRESGAEKTTTQTYESEEDFKAADPDTYKSYESGAAGNFHFFFNDPSSSRFWMAPHMRGQMKSRVDTKELQEAAEAMRRHAEKLRSQMGDQADGTGDNADKPQSAVSFEVEPDGSVRVTMRSGDAEVVERFSSVEEMRSARPELGEKYDSIRGSKN